MSLPKISVIQKYLSLIPKHSRWLEVWLQVWWLVYKYEVQYGEEQAPSNTMQQICFAESVPSQEEESREVSRLEDVVPLHWEEEEAQLLKGEASHPSHTDLAEVQHLIEKDEIAVLVGDQEEEEVQANQIDPLVLEAARDLGLPWRSHQNAKAFQSLNVKSEHLNTSEVQKWQFELQFKGKLMWIFLQSKVFRALLGLPFQALSTWKSLFKESQTKIEFTFSRHLLHPVMLLFISGVLQITCQNAGKASNHV